MDNDPIIEQLARAVYSPNSTSSLTQIAVRAFRESAGFAKGLGIENDKWLHTLSVDDTLVAVQTAFSLANSLKIEKFTREDLNIFTRLSLEKFSKSPNLILEKSVARLLAQENEKTAVSCLNKIFIKMNESLLFITPETLLSVSNIHPKFFDLCYEDYKKSLGSSCANHWMLTSSFQSPELYAAFCDYMLRNAPSELPSFVSLCSKRGRLFTLYSGEEQSVVFLIETSTVCVMEKMLKDFTVGKIIDNLMKITETKPDTVVKLLHHFPCLGDWIIDYVDENETARRMCLWILTR